jgi:YegS/Rv2252/BmrU family lipid kinase
VTDAEIVAIVNPLSGAGATSGVAEARVALLNARFDAARLNGSVHLTERRFHAGEMARDAVARGAKLVIAWGGDGTINEVGTALAGTGVVLGIIPAGSGNGFASELGLPRTPEAAIDTALGGRDRPIDGGDLGGRLFFNIAGIGFDAVIAEQFNQRPLGRRGMGPYVQIGLRQTFTYRAVRYRIRLDDERFETSALLIAFANGREYGNKIRLAPHARMDDGKLEAMVVEDRGTLARLWCGRYLALGTADKAPRIIKRSIVSAEIDCDGEMPYHLDGEIGRARGPIAVKILPKLLTVRVPR